MSPPGSQNERPLSAEFDKERLSLDVWLGAHGLQDDFDSLAPLLKGRRYDIWVPEFVGISFEHQETIRSIAGGDRKAYKTFMRSLRPESPLHLLFKSLYGSHLKVFFADYTPEQAAADEDFQRDHYGSFTFEEVGSLEKAIAHCIERSNVAARSYARREENIVNNLETNLPSFIEQHAKLRERESIRLLVSIGLSHIKLPERLSEAGYRVGLTLPDGTLSASVELLHKIQKAEAIERSLAVQAALDMFISTVVTHRDSLRLSSITRRITQTVPEGEAARLIPSFRRFGKELIADFVQDSISKLGIVDPDLKVL